MCDHCVKREIAFESLTDDEQTGVLEFKEQTEPSLLLMAQTGHADFTSAYVKYGDTLDLLLGIGTVPDSPASLS